MPAGSYRDHVYPRVRLRETARYVLLPRVRIPQFLRIVYRCFPFSPIALKHRDRQKGCALRSQTQTSYGMAINIPPLMPSECSCPGPNL
jgi:hypothetical protein